MLASVRLSFRFDCHDCSLCFIVLIADAEQRTEGVEAAHPHTAGGEGFPGLREPRPDEEEG